MPKPKITYTLTVEPEDIPVEGNASAIDPATDRKIAERIYRQLDAGNEWAWCVVTVTAKVGRFSGLDSLGGCSYASEKAFARSGVLSWMKRAAREDLLAQLSEAIIDGGEARALLMALEA